MKTLLCLAAATGLVALSACGATSAKSNGIDGAAGAADAPSTGTFLPAEPSENAPDMLGASPVKCEGTPLPEPSIVRACVLAAACSPYLQDEPLSDCIALDLPGSGALPQCAVTATSCDDVTECLGSGFYSDACAPDEMGVTCVGSKIVDCGAIPHTFVDCAKRGGTCARYSSNDDGTLDAADCAVEKTCTGSSAAAACRGSKRVLCIQGMGFGEDCAARGLTCVGATGGAVCALARPACDQPESGSCDTSGNGSYCTAEKQSLAFGCAQLDLKCEEAPERAHGLKCASATCPAKEAAACAEECDGSAAHLCIGGERFSIDCASYGFPTCILETRPGVGDRARCGRL